MERTTRNKALAVLIVLLIIFGAYCVYLFSVKVERRAVICTFVDVNQPVLDNLNYSEFQDMFYQSEFLEYYQVGPPIDNYSDLVIIPKHNPDIVFILSQYDEYIYLRIDGYMKVGPFGATESFFDLQEEIITELNIISEHLGLSEHLSHQGFDDYDFAVWPEFHHYAGFFGLAAFIIVYTFALFYKDGWMLRNPKAIDNFPDLIVGMWFIYLGIAVGLFAITMIIVDWLFYEMLVCLAVPGILLLVGFYLVSSVARKQTQ